MLGWRSRAKSTPSREQASSAQLSCPCRFGDRAARRPHRSVENNHATRNQSGHWGMSRAELEKRILRLHKGGTGILKIGKALGIGTGTVSA
jgi:hypothetical protein